MMHRRGFGAVSARERRQADRFFAELVGGPGASRRGRSVAPRHGESLAEQDPASEPLFTLGRSVGIGGKNLEADVIALKHRLAALGFDWLTLDAKVDADTKHAIKLFQSIIKGNDGIVGDGLVDVPGTTYRWLQAVNAPRWQLMPQGAAAEGFYNAERSDVNDDYDYGTSWMAETIRGAGAHYRDHYLKDHPTAALLTINDVSRHKGAKPKLKANGDPEHAGHRTGMVCDVRLPRTDGTVGIKAGEKAFTWESQAYDRDAARAVLQALRAQPLVKLVYFNDEVLRTEGLCTWAKGHDDHIHFGIKAPPQGEIETVWSRFDPMFQWVPGLW